MLVAACRLGWALQAAMHQHLEELCAAHTQASALRLTLHLAARRLVSCSPPSGACPAGHVSEAPVSLLPVPALRLTLLRSKRRGAPPSAAERATPGLRIPCLTAPERPEVSWAAADPVGVCSAPPSTCTAQDGIVWHQGCSSVRLLRLDFSGQHALSINNFAWLVKPLQRHSKGS